MTVVMKEVVFIVEPAPEGGYTASAGGASIFTEADTWTDLETNVRDAVRCHFGIADRPTTIHLRLATAFLTAKS